MCFFVLNFDFQILSGLIRPREQGIEDPAAVRAHVGSAQEGEAGQSPDGSSAHRWVKPTGRQALEGPAWGVGGWGGGDTIYIQENMQIRKYIGSNQSQVSHQTSSNRKVINMEKGEFRKILVMLE